MAPLLSHGESRGTDRVLGVLAGAMLAVLLVGTWASIRRSSRQAALLRDILLVRDEWRTFVKQCPTGKAWRMVDGTFVAGPLRAEVGTERIVFHLDTGQKAVTLPRGTRASFSFVDTKGAAPAAVLTLAWRSSWLWCKRDFAVSVVACAEPRVQRRGPPGIMP
jgi:hypothetical protein